MNNLATIQKFGQDNLATLKNWSKEPRVLQTLGIVAVAATTGAVAGLFVTKGLLAAKGTLAAKTMIATKGGAVALPPHVAQNGVALLNQAAANSAHALQSANTLLNSLTTNSTAALNNATGLLNSVTTNGTALSHQLTSLLNTLSSNVLPLTAGAVGGGAVGVGVTQYKVNEVQARLDEQTAQTEVYQAETARLQDVVQEMVTKVNELSVPSTPPPIVPESAPAPLPVNAPAPDQLEQIRGIGPVFARHLNAAGIFTFADLAAQTPEQLQAIMASARANRMFHPEEWIEQARQLGAAAESATTAPRIAPESDRPTPTASITLDRLESIAGITPLYANRLNAAGILTYTDLAAQTPARLREISGATEDEAIIQQWIAAAERLRA